MGFKAGTLVCSPHVMNVPLPYKKVRDLIAQLKYFYTNACSTGSNQEELESSHLTSITETWCAESRLEHCSS